MNAAQDHNCGSMDNVSPGLKCYHWLDGVFMPGDPIQGARWPMLMCGTYHDGVMVVA